MAAGKIIGRARRARANLISRVKVYEGHTKYKRGRRRMEKVEGVGIWPVGVGARIPGLLAGNPYFCMLNKSLPTNIW